MNPRLAPFVRPALATTLYLSAALFAGEDESVGFGALTGNDGGDGITDAARWDPQTWFVELYNGTDQQLLEPNFDKLMAAVEIVTSNTFEQSLSDFIRLCNVLADSPTDGQFDPAELHEIAWALIEATLLTGEAPELQAEILGYIQNALTQFGMTKLPQSVLSILGDKVSQAPSQWTDDPEMFAIVNTAADGRADEVDAFVQQRLQRLEQEVVAAGLKEPGWLNQMLEQLHTE